MRVSLLIRKNMKNKNGFSLVELLVVISIIAVLSAVLVANFMGMRERARDAQKIQDLNAIKSALRMYYNDKQSYPSSGGIGNYCTDCLNIAVGASYMTSIDSVGYSYAQMDTNSDGFYLKVGLEAGAGDDDTNSQIKCGVGVGDTADKVFMVCAN